MQGVVTDELAQTTDLLPSSDLLPAGDITEDQYKLLREGQKAMEKEVCYAPRYLIVDTALSIAPP